MAERILVAYDGTPQAEEALAFAREEWPDAAMTLLYVINPVEAGYSASAGVPSGAEEWYESAKRTAEELLAEAREEHGDDLDGETTVGRPSRVIVETAEEDEFDHIVIGSHGRSGVSRILLGSVAESVVRDAPVPVTVVR